MSVLLVVMLVAAVGALGLGIAGGRRVGPVALVAEAVMLVAMLDVHVSALHMVPAPFWALLLGGCAMGTAAVDRWRRRSRPGGDHLHALGMLLGAVFVLLAGGHAGAGAGAGHSHGAVLLPVGVAVAVHAGVVLWNVVGGRVPRVESVRRAASLVSVLAMGAMVVVH
ncbi:hypothetical protein EDF52_114113 [Curtobacterium sp. PhB42]|uniref:hypothetical protein n=1 Tax=unclassified Curtobacterium TaxID=257496 RepID=UPI001043CEF3|nr:MULTISPECIES: hypothetical protein [unclassified Curtobacterium]TCU50291.1 hypothetical protein EDF33_101792 [Curtobacterium sp. PhB146]TCU83175.1 hypothetical protein EDF48_109112 [Curtobacterium sp. PhB191]TDW42516.1 hypothetical protein EDF52_114113 [Curtobacterium sp. PhB42]TDW55394.1 hypothetical protein EDF47_10517 [Curtobacterium sp. PhB190]